MTIFKDSDGRVYKGCKPAGRTVEEIQETEFESLKVTLKQQDKKNNPQKNLFKEAVEKILKDKGLI